MRDLQVILDFCDPQGGAAGKALYLGLEDAKPALLVAAGPFLLPARTPQREGGWGAGISTRLETALHFCSSTQLKTGATWL